MITKEQFNILKVFKDNISKELTFRQVKMESRQKSNNVMQMALKKFQSLGITKAHKIGNVTAYSLNLQNNLTLAFLNLLNQKEIRDNRKVPKNILDEIQTRIFRCTRFFVLAVFGSYAENKATRKSDLDIAVIVCTEESRKETIPFIETIKRREVQDIDYHVFTEKEFIEMLESPEQNLGKEIYRKNIVYYGYINYLTIIRGITHETIG